MNDLFPGLLIFSFLLLVNLEAGVMNTIQCFVGRVDSANAHSPGRPTRGRPYLQGVYVSWGKIEGEQTSDVTEVL